MLYDFCVSHVMELPNRVRNGRVIQLRVWITHRTIA